MANMQQLSAEALDLVPAQLGVFEIADRRGSTQLIGMAGAREPFGLRGALARHLDHESQPNFRYEITHAYLTRWQELLMLHRHEHGDLPPGNADDHHLLGRLSPSLG